MEKGCVLLREIMGGGTLKPNKIQSILDKNYQGDSPYSLEKTAKLMRKPTKN